MRWPERAILNSRGLSQTISPVSGGFIAADLNVDKGYTSPVRGLGSNPKSQSQSKHPQSDCVPPILDSFLEHCEERV
jgi:hypothetical protein